MKYLATFASKVLLVLTHPSRFIFEVYLQRKAKVDPMNSFVFLLEIALN